VETLKNAVKTMETDDGVTFESVASIPDIWHWQQNAFFAQIAGDDRVFLRTYNHVVGSVRFETYRVTDDSCAYKHSSWSTYMLKERRPVLYASELRHPACYGPREYGLSTEPFGPWWDSAKWQSEPDGRYVVNLGSNPTLGQRKLTEMKIDRFLSENTRRATISMTVYNNALPMFCFVKMVFDVSPTGEIKSHFSLEAMNVQEYLLPTFFLQVALELLMVWWTLSHIYREVLECYGEMKAKGGLAGLMGYLSQVQNIMDWLQSLALIAATSQWIWLILDMSRDIDLDTKEFVDLEDAAAVFRNYNISYNAIVLITLFSMLQYTGLDDRMALLTRSVYESINFLVPFLFLFMIFVLMFAIIGHLLYGPVLGEWSTLLGSIVTAIDIMMANYQFINLEEGLDPDDDVSYAVAFIFYYVYFFLMMLIVLNIIIAILMDGYASVTETINSNDEQKLKYNVGPLLPSIFASWKRKLHFWHRHDPSEKIPWTEEQWEEALLAVSDKRRQLGLAANIVKTGTLVLELRALPNCEKEDVTWQIEQVFQNRRFKAPTNVLDPFEEPDVESEVKFVSKTVREQDARLRRVVQMMTDLHVSHGSAAPLARSQQETIARQAEALDKASRRIEEQAMRIAELEAGHRGASPVQEVAAKTAARPTAPMRASIEDREVEVTDVVTLHAHEESQMRF